MTKVISTPSPTSSATSSADPSASDVQPPSRGRRFLDALDERLGIGALEYPVPAHANNLAWSLGGVTAGAFGILIVTGSSWCSSTAPFRRPRTPRSATL